jgi:hypothetical protein
MRGARTITYVTAAGLYLGRKWGKQQYALLFLGKKCVIEVRAFGINFEI